MTTNDDLNRHSDHIDVGELRRQFPTGGDFADFLTAHTSAVLPIERLQSLVYTEDFAQRLQQAAGRDDMVVVGSRTNMGRPPADLPWPDDFRDPNTSIHPAYYMPRTAYDLDLYFPGFAPREGERYAQMASRAISSAQGPGLGGLVTYTLEPASIRADTDGHLVADVTAHPLDQALDPVTFEVDVKSPTMVANAGDPEIAQRPLQPFAFAGMRQDLALMHPSAEQTADKLVLLAQRPGNLDTSPTGRFRIKDVPDVYYTGRTSQVDAQRVRAAMETNHNLAAGQSPPATYRIYGRTGTRRLPWEQQLARMRREQPQLEHYPSPDQMLDIVEQLGSAVMTGDRGAEAGASAQHELSTTPRPQALDRTTAPAAPVERETVTLRSNEQRSALDPAQPRTRLGEPVSAPKNETTGSMVGKLRTKGRQFRAAFNAFGEGINYTKTRVAADYKFSAETRPVVVTFGSAQLPETSPAYQMAKKANYLLGKAGWAGRTGGGPGIMRAANEGLREAGAPSYAVNIKLKTEQALNEYVDEGRSVTADEFPERVQAMHSSGRTVDAFIVMRGGAGTGEELWNLLDQMNTGKMPMTPLVIEKGFYESTINQLKVMDQEGTFNLGKFKGVIRSAGTAEEVVKHVTEGHARLTANRKAAQEREKQQRAAGRSSVREKTQGALEFAKTLTHGFPPTRRFAKASAPKPVESPSTATGNTAVKHRHNDGPGLSTEKGVEK